MKNYKLTPTLFKLKGDGLLSERMISPTALFTRQRSFNDSFSAKVDVKESRAGLTVYLESDQHYDLILEERNGKWILSRRLSIGPAIDEKVIASVEKVSGKGLPKLMIECKKGYYILKARINNKNINCGRYDARFLSSEVAGDFTGVMLGIFIEKQGTATFSEIEIKRNGRKLWERF